MSKHGTAARAVHHLHNLLYGNDITVINLEHDTVPDLKPYTHMIIGGSVHMGFVQSKITEFCGIHLKELLTKKVGLFICNMDREHVDDLFENSFPSPLLNHAFVKSSFGGEILLEKMNFFQRFLVKRLAGYKKDVHELDINAINAFVREFKRNKPTLQKNVPEHYTINNETLALPDQLKTDAIVPV
jgi:menaquinone-dependent protoporphyrinogen oxidase